jgi:hypothetical protein
MSNFCGGHRPPRGGVEAILNAADALAVIDLAMARPARAETIVVFLEDDRTGRTILAVDGTADDDAVVDVVEVCCEATLDHDTTLGLVVASIRPNRGMAPVDAERWHDLDELADSYGVELIDWFVIAVTDDRTVACCPRDLAEVPARWAEAP